MAKVKKSNKSYMKTNTKHKDKVLQNKDLLVRNNYKNFKVGKPSSRKAEIKNTPRVFGNIEKREYSKSSGQNVPVPKNYYFNKVKHLSLRERMMAKLKAARFRYLNEQLYTSNGQQMERLFKEEEGSYKAYHEGFRQQVARWPINPLDIIIKSLQKRAEHNLVIADFGCGEAKLEENLKNQAKVHSIDLVALKENVIQCDMANTPLESNIVDVAVFCLSLMSTNLSSYIAEANRVLKEGGLLEIAEVESRFENVKDFIKTIEVFGFKSVSTNLSHKVFYFLNFRKVANISKKRKNKLPELSLKPCLYKKR